MFFLGEAAISRVVGSCASSLCTLVSTESAWQKEYPKMKRPLIGFLLILHSSGILAKSIEQTAHQCYANNSDPYLLFASKTSYFNVDNEEAKPIEIEGEL